MSRILPIITHPDPFLRKPAKDVAPAKIRERSFQLFLDDLTRTMGSADGIGLAAIQVGSQDDVCVISMEDGPMHLVNAKIVRYGKKKATSVEGCLSVPGYSGDVHRPTEIDVEAYDRFGDLISFTASGLLARVIQHETDHLKGILYIDRADRIWKDDKRKK